MFDTVTKIQIPIDANDQLDSDNITQEVVHTEDSGISQFPARFRHATALTEDGRLFVHGGKYFDESVGTTCIYSDAHFIGRDFKLEKIQVDENVCTARHSHCISTWKHFLIISGGLDQNENPLDDVMSREERNRESRLLYEIIKNTANNMKLSTSGKELMQLAPSLIY